MMNQEETGQLLLKAQEYIPAPDVIIDVYDMTYVWVSDYHCQVTGYTKEEEHNMSISVNSQLVDGDTSKMAPEAMNPYSHFKRKMILTSKSGKKMSVDVHGVVIVYGKHP